MPSAIQSSNDRLVPLFKYASLGLLVLYLVNCFTPLRLHVDAIRYFFLEHCMEQNCIPGERGADDYLPFGYTFLLVVFAKLGILKSFTIVFVNCLYLFGSLFFIRKIFNFSRALFYPCLLLILLNWSTIKFVIHPLSEMQFMFFSLASVYLFRIYSTQKKWWQLGLSILLCMLSILTRTAGIALFFAILFSLVWMFWKQLKYFIQHHKILVGLGIASLLAVVIFARELGLTYYTSFVTDGAQQDLLTFVTTNLRHHFEEVAELAGNIPANKVYRFISPGTGHLLYIGFGVITVALCAWLIFVRRNQTPVIVKAYLAFYSLLIFNWPFYDPRFFVPVLPLAIAALLASPVKKNKPARIVALIYCVLYAIAGLIAIGYTTYTSLNKEELASKHANGVYRNEYEIHFFGKPQSDTAKVVDKGILEILTEHD